MSNLTPDERRAFAGVIRGQARLIRELTAAKALLKSCQEKHLYPVDHKRELEEIKQKPDYGQIAQGLEAVATILEQGADETDLGKLLKKLPAGSLTN